MALRFSHLWIMASCISLPVLGQFPFETMNSFSRLLEANFLDGEVLKDSYDYVIVGASPAGCVLANRLSENPYKTVLLIEAGSPPLAIGNIPFASVFLQDSDYSWGYVTTVQNHSCLSSIDQRCNVPHGKGLGGGSLINSMMFTRGNRRDFQQLEAAGNNGWSYFEMLKYFKKMEDANIPFPDSDYRGSGGPLSIQYSPFRSKLAEAYVKSAQAAGYAEIDYNTLEQIGVSYSQLTSTEGQRDSAFRSYLEPVMNRSNLDVISNAVVTKIIIDENTLSATGVQYQNMLTGVKRTILAAQEVILSAGAIESPKILMLSGIGPSEHLSEFGIPVLKNLPVGKTLIDHVGTVAPIFTFKQPFPDIPTTDPLSIVDQILQFFNGTGILTSTSFETVTYLKTNSSIYSDPGYPDIELVQEFTTLAADPTGIVQKTTRLTDELYASVFAPLKDKIAMHFSPFVLHPQSVGSVKLASSNPLDKPIIDPNYYSERIDVQILIEGIREALRITSSGEFQKLGPQLYEAIVPGCDYTFNTDEYWECYIRHITIPLSHQMATCRMGPATDVKAVVDDRLRVHGIDKLRVADIGVWPIPVSGHTVAASYVIGEKAADMIITECRCWSKGLSARLRNKI